MKKFLDFDGVTYLTKKILLLSHPVGSIYMNISEVNPNELFGGTWEKLEDKFLLAAGPTFSLGTSGGEINHTLTVAEIPSHTHMSAYQEQDSPTNSTTVNAFTKDSFVVNTKIYRSTNNKSVLNSGGAQVTTICLHTQL